MPTLHDSVLKEIVILPFRGTAVSKPYLPHSVQPNGRRRFRCPFCNKVTAVVNGPVVECASCGFTRPTTFIGKPPRRQTGPPPPTPT